MACPFAQLSPLLLLSFLVLFLQYGASFFSPKPLLASIHRGKSLVGTRFLGVRGPCLDGKSFVEMLRETCCQALVIIPIFVYLFEASSLVVIAVITVSPTRFKSCDKMSFLGQGGKKSQHTACETIPIVYHVLVSLSLVLTPSAECHLHHTQ